MAMDTCNPADHILNKANGLLSELLHIYFLSYEPSDLPFEVNKMWVWGLT